MKTTTKEKQSIEDAKRTSYAELSALYDRIYNIADKLIKKHNPCNIHIRDKKVKCAFHAHYRENSQLCCCGCPHWNNGCTIKCLKCKLHLCSYAENNNKLVAQRLRQLRAYLYSTSLIYCFYWTKETSLKATKKEVECKQLKDKL